MTVLNLSFSACGFLGIYQLGVAEALLHHGAKLLSSVKAFTGASAGSLVATMLVTAPDKLEHIKDFACRFASDVSKQKFGAMTPGYDFMLKLREGLEDILPSNAHEIAGDRLHVSITHARTRRNCMVSHFTSREDLIKVLLASSFVPVYAGVKGVEYKGQTWIDGGLSNWLPVLPVGRTITVSPFSGNHDICPKHEDLISISFKLPNMPIMISTTNIIRVKQALFPPMQHKMESLSQDGYEDALQFLKKENWFE